MCILSRFDLNVSYVVICQVNCIMVFLLPDWMHIWAEVLPYIREACLHIPMNNLEMNFS